MLDSRIIARFPADLPENTADDFAIGAQIGLLNLRPGTAEEEQNTISQIRRKLTGALRENRQILDRGIKFGLDLRLVAESAAVEMNRFLAGDLLRGRLSRLAWRKRRASRMLRLLEPIDRELLTTAFSRRYGVDLIDVIPRVFGRKESSRLVALLTGLRQEGARSKEPRREAAPAAADSTGPFTGSGLDEAPPADPALLYDSIWNRKRGWPGRFFAGAAPAERRELLESFEERYGPFKKQIEKNFKGWEREFILDLAQHGQVPLGKLFYLCIVGIGTDEKGLQILLPALRPEELARAAGEFHQIWKERAPLYERPFPRLLGNLERRIWIETGGDSFFDLQRYFHSASSEPDTSPLDHLEKIYEHERSGRLLGKMRAFLGEGAILDRDISVVRRFYSKFGSNLNHDQAVQIRFDALVQYAALDCRIFRTLKHTVGNRISSLVAASTAAGATFALTLMHVQIGIIMATVGTVSLSSRVGLKVLLKGRGYHFAEIGADIFFGVLDGCTLFTAYIFRQAMIRFGTRFLTSLTFKSGLSRISGIVGGDRTAQWGARYDLLLGRPGRSTENP